MRLILFTSSSQKLINKPRLNWLLIRKMMIIFLIEICISIRFKILREMSTFTKQEQSERKRKKSSVTCDYSALKEEEKKKHTNTIYGLIICNVLRVKCTGKWRQWRRINTQHSFDYFSFPLVFVFFFSSAFLVFGSRSLFSHWKNSNKVVPHEYN